jgi:hypothetical protein
MFWATASSTLRQLIRSPALTLPRAVAVLASRPSDSSSRLSRASSISLVRISLCNLASTELAWRRTWRIADAVDAGPFVRGIQ